MLARYIRFIILIGVLAFLAARGYVLHRRDKKDSTSHTAQLSQGFQTDRQYRMTQALIVSAYQGNLRAVKQFLPESIPSLIPQAVNAAGRGGQTGIIKYLIAQGYDLNRLGDGPYLLSAAAAYGYTDLAKFIQERGVNISAADRQEALIWAVARGHSDMARQLLDAGADVNATAGSSPVPAYNGLTPLMIAANYGHVDVVRLLLSRHADVNRKTGFAKTALSYARDRDLPAATTPDRWHFPRTISPRAAEIKQRIDRTDDAAAVVKLLRQAGETE